MIRPLILPVSPLVLAVPASAQPAAGIDAANRRPCVNARAGAISTPSRSIPMRTAFSIASMQRPSASPTLRCSPAKA
jgi:hypothetical protein